MKIIFLDIDGVVNSHAWYEKRPKLGPDHSREEFKKNEFDPEAVKILRNIIAKTGAKVVLSSTWRLSEEGREEVKRYCCDFISYTGECTSRIRGAEIHMWINDNINYKERDKVRYVILDDDSDMLMWQKDNFFRTDYKIGLTNEIADGVIRYLNGIGES